MIRTLKAAALTAALAAAALVSTPVTAFAAESHGRPAALNCEGCRLPGHPVAGRGGDANHRGIIDDRGIIDRRGGITDNRGGVEDRRDHRRRDRSIVVDVSQNVGPLLLRSQRPGSDFPDALHVGSSVVRVRTDDNADYRALHNSGFVQIVVRGGRTQCDAQGRLRCAVENPSVVRVFRV